MVSWRPNLAPTIKTARRLDLTKNWHVRSKRYPFTTEQKLVEISRIAELVLIISSDVPAIFTSPVWDQPQIGVRLHRPGYTVRQYRTPVCRRLFADLQARTPSMMLSGHLVATTRANFNPACLKIPGNSFFVRSRPQMTSI